MYTVNVILSTTRLREALVRTLISLAAEAGEMDWNNYVYFLRSRH